MATIQNSPQLIQQKARMDMILNSVHTMQQKTKQALIHQNGSSTASQIHPPVPSPIQMKASINGPVPYKKYGDGEVEMSEIKTGNSFMWSFGFAPCVGVCAYGETEEGEKKMAMWHVDATQGDGEDIVLRITEALGENLKEDSVSIAAVQGKDPSSQFNELKAMESSDHFPVDATAVPEKPNVPEADDWWDVEVYMHPGEQVEFATPVPSDYPPPEAAQAEPASAAAQEGAAVAPQASAEEEGKKPEETSVDG